MDEDKWYVSILVRSNVRVPRFACGSVPSFAWIVGQRVSGIIDGASMPPCLHKNSNGERERERRGEKRWHLEDGVSRSGGDALPFSLSSPFFFFTFLPCPSTSLPVGNKPFIQAPRPDCGDKSASGTPSANHRSSFPFETSHRRVKEIGSRSLRRSVLLPGISCRGIRALVYSSSRRAGKGGRR